MATYIDNLKRCATALKALTAQRRISQTMLEAHAESEGFGIDPYDCEVETQLEMERRAEIAEELKR